MFVFSSECTDDHYCFTRNKQTNRVPLHGKPGAREKRWRCNPNIPLEVDKKGKSQYLRIIKHTLIYKPLNGRRTYGDDEENASIELVEKVMCTIGRARAWSKEVKGAASAISESWRKWTASHQTASWFVKSKNIYWLLIVNAFAFGVLSWMRALLRIACHCHRLFAAVALC